MYGEWGRDWHRRLFNRKFVQWDEKPVHERLIHDPDITEVKLGGYLHHRTVKDIDHFARKTVHYALLNA